MTIPDRLATFATMQARSDLQRITKIATFSDLQGVAELRDWLPQAANDLATVIAGALLADDPNLAPDERVKMAIQSVDEFRDGLLARVSTGIGKRHRPNPAGTVAKVDTSWAKGIL